MSTVTLIAAASLLLAGCATITSPSALISPPLPVGSPAPSSPNAVAFSRLTIPDGSQPAVEIGVWQPTESVTWRRPLVIISHGNGGDYRSHRDTAEALARSGFVVASLTHTGDNWRDQSRATDLAGRSRQLSVLIDYMLGQWDGMAGIDPARIGAFGYSAGGFTVLAAAGGEPDLTRLIDHCRSRPTFFDCRLVSQHAGTVTGSRTPPRLPHDTRLKALVVAAPALGFTFTREGLASVTQPIQLWQAGNDQILPSPYYAEPVRDALPRPPEYIRVDGAGHFDFLPPCSAALAAKVPMICDQTPGFDRGEFHVVLKEQMVRFFKTHL